ncbi:hypothetical protein [Methylobacterium sp. WL120]|uniref:hypothetical protein n=1 Tax=Methylobacterium sp. WL120 TaxID=2603887 RepID=UPI0011CB4D41|nr:hypothetical protein [Methylobacterium sp. WL120]TXM68561.1 hypothetical protein FV229_07420 [Methylobacterium sp. WL120]TXN09780.1 hypothetical protein FV219_07005 [Methylobacterium sp. WL122]
MSYVILSTDTPDPLTPEQLDGNFLALDTALRAIEARARAVTGLGDLVVSDDGQSITMPLTDGSDEQPRNLPLGRFEPVGPWATGTAYLARDLVSQGRGSYVALADHMAGAFADDLAAGLWLAVAKGAAGGVNPRGTYDPGVAYSKGDAVLVSSDGGVTFVQKAARTDLTAGTALDHVDGDGNPSWVAVSLRQRTHDLVYSADLSTRHVGAPLTIPMAMAGSVARSDPAPGVARTVTILAQASAPGSPVRTIGSFVWAAGSSIATPSGPGGLLSAGDTVTVTVNGSARPFVVGLAMTIVGVHV